MREIIFRGKRVKNNEWVYGSFLKQAGERISKDEVAPIECWIYGMRGETALVDPETVGQYTGLTDKNGTKIFEGDIVKVENALVRGIFAVEYCGISACFIVSCGERRYFLGGCNSEVIGNIHDNPDRTAC